ncbi:MAG: response regulator transcription factor [Gemmatimonadota bacterium]
MTRVLVIEDTAGIAQALRANLELEGHEVSVAQDGEAGLFQWRSWSPSVVILDLMLPKIDGLDLLRTMREDGNQTPVLILSARTSEVEKVPGFRLGADDYVTKPFGLMEILARVDALLRRRAREAPADGQTPLTKHTFGEIEVTVETRVVLRRGEPVVLRPKEFDLLVALIRHAGRIVSRRRLLLEVWGYEPSVVSRTVDTHIRELRRHLEADPANPRHVMTHRGSGYMLER